MSRSKQVTVTRSYQPVPEDCARAVELLLKQLANQEGGRPTAPENAERSLNAVRVEDIIQERP